MAYGGQILFDCTKNHKRAMNFKPADRYAFLIEKKNYSKPPRFVLRTCINWIGFKHLYKKNKYHNDLNHPLEVSYIVISSPHMIFLKQIKDINFELPISFDILFIQASLGHFRRL